MKCVRFFSFVVLSFFFYCGAMYSQHPNHPSHKLPDSIKNRKYCLYYDFKVGDTLVYHSFSRDSIVYETDQPTVTKERTETWRYVVEKKKNNRNFLVSAEMIGFASTESQGEIRNQIRMTSLWTGRKVFLEMDSTGKRYDVTAVDTVSSAIAPGGAFQPPLFMRIGETCKYGKDSWMVGDEEHLIENGVPVPIVNYTSLARITGEIDTLGVHCDQLQWTTTGQGLSLVVVASGKTAQVTSVINQFSRMELSTVYKIPVHLFATSEIKFTMDTPSGKKVKGTNYIRSDYTIRNYRFEKK